MRGLSRRALIAAVRPDTAAFASLIGSNADRIDWAWVLERAAAHKVAALLAARLDTCGITGRLDAALRVRVEQVQRDAAKSAAAAQQTLQELAGHYERAEIPFLLIKGSVLAEGLYGDPALRPFEDVDLVVRPDAVAQSEQLMRSLGYRLGQVRQLLGARPRNGADARIAEAVTRRFYERFHYELPLVPANGDRRLPVDLHWHVAPQSVLHVSTADLWKHTVRTAVAGVPIITLNPEATLLHLVVHATVCSFSGFKLLPLCDIAWAVRRSAAPYRRLWELADAWQVRPHLASVLATVERALGVPIPVEMWADAGGPPALQPALRPVADAAFLVDYRSNAGVPWWQRARAEILWNVAMRCLRYNLTRSTHVRLSRLRWRLLRWRHAFGHAS